MPTIEPALLALVVAVGFAVGFVKSAVGLGGGAISVPLLAAFLDPRVALGITAPIMLVTDLTTIRAHWRRWHWPTVRVLVPAALLGIGLGALFVATATAPGLRRAMGVVALAFVAAQARRLVGLASGTAGPLAPPGPVSRVLASACGVGGGLASILAHSGGLVFAFYMLPRLSRATFVASLAVLLLVLDLAKMPLLYSAGALTPRDLALGLVAAPVMMAGSRLGEQVNGRLSERVFLSVVTTVVFATGVWLLVR